MPRHAARSSDPPGTANPAAATPTRHVLPRDLQGTLRGLTDADLDALVEAVNAEARRRDRPGVAPTPAPRPRSGSKAAVAALTPGQLSAVRAAIKAGISPNRVARQFGLSPAAVRAALADGLR